MTLAVLQADVSVLRRQVLRALPFTVLLSRALLGRIQSLAFRIRSLQRQLSVVPGERAASIFVLVVCKARLGDS